MSAPTPFQSDSNERDTDQRDSNEPPSFQNPAGGAKQDVYTPKGDIADPHNGPVTDTLHKLVKAGECSQDLAARECQRCVQVIRRNPLTAIGIASLVGFAIGVGVTLQSSRRNDSWRSYFS